MSIIDDPAESIDLIDEDNRLSAVVHTTSEVSGPMLKAKALNWQKDNFALTWAFINYLQEHDRARRAVLPQPGDATAGASKLAIFKEIAKAVLSQFPQYSEHLDNNTVIMSYRNAFKKGLQPY
ncbi:hypothetical protein V1525DRAFT_390836 [Lipomyces kononenkoae]|uniref:Uncharacterized protein n=1 Tax=Lipomyces kononenkoae TaxID=34357 RepID=A0ACC3STW5_LIPKO